MRNVIFVGNGRDFHAIDWFRTIKKICYNREVRFATDLIESEGHAKIVNREEDGIINLYNIDWLLFRGQSTIGNFWRNFIKLAFFPVQVGRLKKLVKNNPDCVYHAHTMYYLFICWKAGVKYIGSPQGDEILIRPYRSAMYRRFAVKSLTAADHLIVDSVNLQNGIMKLCGKKADVIQYGIDVDAIFANKNSQVPRTNIASIRALYPLYRIHEIFQARENTSPHQNLILFYPFWEEGYKEKILEQLKPGDTNYGRMATKKEVYSVLASTQLAISIPESDSSPRSVYESIFSGCCVAITYNPWIETVPSCMRERICLIELEDANWLTNAIAHAKFVTQKPYVPSDKALDMFDQQRSMRLVADKFYS